MFEPKKLYLHENCRDAAIMILNVYSLNDNEAELLVSWWNVGACHNPEPMNVYEDIKIKCRDFAKWHEISSRNYRNPEPTFEQFKVTPAD